MYIYTDATAMDNMYGETTTPAHLCEGNPDFASILEDMLVKGALPFNTHQVYPTVWKADREQLQREQAGTPQQSGVVNPWLSGGQKW